MSRQAQANKSPDTSPEAEASTKDNTKGDEISQDLIIKQEEAARADREADEEKKRAEPVKKRRGRRKPEETKAEREEKVRKLEELLQKSAAFSSFLTKKTKALGRVGSSLDGKTLGEHDLQMATQPKCMINGTMHDYQLEGLTWMLEICLQGMSGILADEMGLGQFTFGNPAMSKYNTDALNCRENCTNNCTYSTAAREGELSRPPSHRRSSLDPLKLDRRVREMDPFDPRCDVSWTP